MIFVLQIAAGVALGLWLYNNPKVFNSLLEAVAMLAGFAFLICIVGAVLIGVAYLIWLIWETVGVYVTVVAILMGISWAFHLHQKSIASGGKAAFIVAKLGDAIYELCRAIWITFFIGLALALSAIGLAALFKTSKESSQNIAVIALLLTTLFFLVLVAKFGREWWKRSPEYYISNAKVALESSEVDNRDSA